MKYRIVALTNYGWDWGAVGDPNEFDTWDEAQEMIPVLAKNFQCREDELGIEEYEEN